MCYYSLTGPQKDISQDSPGISSVPTAYFSNVVQSTMNMSSPRSTNSLFQQSSPLHIHNMPQLLLSKIYLNKFHILSHAKHLIWTCIYQYMFLFFWFLFLIYVHLLFSTDSFFWGPYHLFYLIYFLFIYSCQWTDYD